MAKDNWQAEPAECSLLPTVGCTQLAPLVNGFLPCIPLGRQASLPSKRSDCSIPGMQCSANQQPTNKRTYFSLKLFKVVQIPSPTTKEKRQCYNNIVVFSLFLGLKHVKGILLFGPPGMLKHSIT